MTFGLRFGSRRGSEVVESALAVLSFALLMLGIMEFGLAGMISNSVAFAAETAARYASVHGSSSLAPATQSAVQAVAQSYAAPLGAGALTVTVTWNPNNNPGSTVTVKVSCGMSPLLLGPSGGLTLQGAATQTISQ
jgi:Flp pilus assembly protein TadG